MKGSFVNRSGRAKLDSTRVCRYCKKHSSGVHKAHEQCVRSPTTRHEYNIVLKDNDLNYKLHLPPDLSETLAENLIKDATFLAKQNIMDCARSVVCCVLCVVRRACADAGRPCASDSLLVGVHRKQRAVSSRELQLPDEEAKAEDAPRTARRYAPPFRRTNGGMTPAVWDGPAVFYMCVHAVCCVGPPGC